MKLGYRKCPYCDGKGVLYNTIKNKRYSTNYTWCQMIGRIYDADLHVKQLEASIDNCISELASVTLEADNLRLGIDKAIREIDDLYGYSEFTNTAPIVVAIIKEHTNICVGRKAG